MDFNDYLNSPVSPLAPGRALGSGLESMLGMNYNNPADAAMPYLNKMGQQLPSYFNPYINAGNSALPGLQHAYSNMMNPNQMIQQIGSGYQASPGFQWQLGQGMKAAQNAAGAGGMMGTPEHQQQAATMAEGLANQDFYHYLSNALGLYGQGVRGEQGLYNSGLEASMGLGEDLASIAGSQAGLAYQGQNAENEARGGAMGSLIGGISNILPMLAMG